MRHLLTALVVLLTVVAVFFVLMLGWSEKIASINGKSAPAEIAPKKVASLSSRESQNIIDENEKVAKKAVVKHPIQDSEVITQVEPPPNPYVAPAFYNIDQNALNGLSQVQQEALVDVMNDYISFHSEWDRSMDHNPTRWNNKMKEMQEALTLKIGPEAVDHVLH